MTKYIIMLIPAFLYGCAQTPKKEERNLLYKKDNFARKSITIEDYKEQYEC